MARNGWKAEMKLKLDEAGNAVIADGKPVYVHDDGKEIPFDAAAAISKISQLNAEAKGHREAKEAALERAKAFDGLDPAEAAKALETIKNIDLKKLLDAGEVDKVKAEAARAFDEKLHAMEAKYKPVVEERDQFMKDLVAEKIGGAFSRSKFIADKLAVPPDIVEARFGHSFKVEGGSVVAIDHAGNKIFSRANPGEVAGFDESLEILVDAYPYKNSILKGSGASGGAGNGGGGDGTGKVYTRAQFGALTPAQKADVAKQVREGSASLVDAI